MSTARYPRDSVDYVGATVVFSHDISEDTILLTVLDKAVKSPDVDADAVEWHEPDYRVNSTDGKTASVYLLKGPGKTLDLDEGSYRVWMRVQDSPEIPLFSTDGYFKVLPYDYPPSS